MLSNSSTHHRKFQLIFLCVFLFFLILNLRLEVSFFIHSIHIFKTQQVQPIGVQFIPLIPYLSKVPWAGYITCLDSSHPLTDVAIMGPYQQAQYVLSPTILDYFHPLHYRYIVLHCPHRADQRLVKIALPGFINLMGSNGISILYRKKDPS